MTTTRFFIALISLSLAGLVLCLAFCDEVDPDEQKYSMTIAFGSCNHHWEERQPMWQEILKNSPDLWIWLGDIIYSDTEDMKKMRQDYETQQANIDYNNLDAAVDIIGIWDDHDYGANNAGKEYKKKDSSKILLLEFLDVPKDNPAWDRLGAYQSYTYNVEALKIKVLLLDTRYFRDSVGTPDGSVIGDIQWQWLIESLEDSDADVHVIGGGIQFLAEDHRFEKWANFPYDRRRLLRVIDDLDVSHPILISGDRHIAEMSLVALPSSKKPLIEITSSGLTHSYTKFSGEENRHRIGNVFSEKNFGLLHISKVDGQVSFTAEIRNERNQIQYVANSNELADQLSD